jgi:parallel beta-helix repeat protein
MLKKLLLLITVLLIAINAESKNLYVDGALGNDSLAIANGSKPFKLIQSAITNAKPGDKILVEGKNKGKQITYAENLIVFTQLSLIGENSPVLDGGKITPTKKNPENIQSTAIHIEANLVKVSGFTIQNYLRTSKSTTNSGKTISSTKVYNTAIFTAEDLIGIRIEDNVIANCNFGIYMISPVQCKIENNKISNIKRSSKNVDVAGYAIVVVPSGVGIEENSIQNNIIENAENIGIAFGFSESDSDPIIDAEGTIISNNRISSCGAYGLMLGSFEGIVDVSKNEFKNNNSALLISGTPIDAIIKDNQFNGSKSKVEVSGDDKYDGALMYRLWQGYNNTFTKATFVVSAIISDEVQKTDGFLNIFNDEAEAQKYFDDKINRIVNK